MDISSIIDVLDRDDALELYNDERTYGDIDQPLEVDWNSTP